jgi:hypothetical protein
MITLIVVVLLEPDVLEIVVHRRILHFHSHITFLILNIFFPYFLYYLFDPFMIYKLPTFYYIKILFHENLFLLWFCFN